jgi:hypothetical protein
MDVARHACPALDPPVFTLHNLTSLLKTFRLVIHSVVVPPKPYGNYFLVYFRSTLTVNNCAFYSCGFHNILTVNNCYFSTQL